MPTTEPSPTLHLHRGQLLRWHAGHAARLRVLAGRAWVTRSGDPQDHFLAAGDSLPVPRAGVAVISAEEALDLCVDECAPAPATDGPWTVAGGAP